MRFEDPPGADEGFTRTNYYKLPVDMQLALEELDHTLANLGAQMLIKMCKDNAITFEVCMY